MRRSSVRLLALMGALGVAACSSDDGLTPGDLTDAQAQALAGVILTQAFTSTSGLDTSPTPVPGGPAAVVVSFSRDAEATVTCQLGGDAMATASLDFESDSDTQVTTIDYTLTLVHNACEVTGDDGTHFTLDGSPNLQLVISVVGDPNGSDWEGSIDGAVDWATSEFEGTCQVGLEFSGTVVAQTSASFTTDGQVCSTAVHEELTIG